MLQPIIITLIDSAKPEDKWKQQKPPQRAAKKEARDNFTLESEKLLPQISGLRDRVVNIEYQSSAGNRRDRQHRRDH